VDFVLFTIYSNLSKFPVCSSVSIRTPKKARALTGSTFGIYSSIRGVLIY